MRILQNMISGISSKLPLEPDSEILMCMCPFRVRSKELNSSNHRPETIVTLHPCFGNLLYHTILYYTILYSTILYYTLLYHTIQYYTILYYALLYSTIPYYTIYYTMLYCTVLYHKATMAFRAPNSGSPDIDFNGIPGSSSLSEISPFWEQQFGPTAIVYTYVYIHIYVCVCLCMCMHVCMYPVL